MTTTTSKTHPEQNEEIPSFLLSVMPAPLSERAKSKLEKLPALAELRALEPEDSNLRALNAKFSGQAAIKDHEAALDLALASGDESTIRAVPSITERRASYENTSLALQVKIKAIHRRAISIIESTLTDAAIRIVLKDRADAEADFFAVFEKHGLPQPETANIVGDPFTRLCQDFQRQLEHAKRGIDQPIKNYLRSFGA